MLKLENIGITFNPGTSDENIALKNINLEIQKGDFMEYTDYIDGILLVTLL